MTNEVAEDQDLEQPMVAATKTLRATVLRLLLRLGEVHPQLILLAVARVTGDLVASAALAGGKRSSRGWASLPVIRHSPLR